MVITYVVLSASIVSKKLVHGYMGRIKPGINYSKKISKIAILLFPTF